MLDTYEMRTKVDISRNQANLLSDGGGVRGGFGEKPTLVRPLLTGNGQATIESPFIVAWD